MELRHTYIAEQHGQGTYRDIWRVVRQSTDQLTIADHIIISGISEYKARAIAAILNAKD